MPYATIADLPADVQKLPAHDQEIFRAAFNAAAAGTCKDEADPEACAMAVAHAAVTKAHAAKSADASLLGKLFKTIGDFLDGQQAAPGASVTVINPLGPAAGDRVRVTREARIVKTTAEKRLIYAVVYEPNVPDAHDDAMTADEIEKAAHGFMQKYSTMRAQGGLEHALDLPRDAFVVVENYIAPMTFKLGAQTITKGSWVLVTKALDDQLWADVKSGVYTGYSFEGWGQRVPAGA